MRRNNKQIRANGMSPGIGQGAVIDPLARSMLAQEQLQAQMGARLRECAQGIYTQLAAAYIANTDGPLDPEALRDFAQRSRQAAPYLMEAFGVEFTDLPPRPEQEQAAAPETPAEPTEQTSEGGIVIP